MSLLTIIRYGIPAAAILAALWWVDNRAYHSGHADGLAACVSACAKEQNKTKELNDELIKNRNRILADSARYKRLHPNTCYNLEGKAELSDRRDEHAGVHGISTDWLRDYAALSETYRSELEVCAGN